MTLRFFVFNAFLMGIIICGITGKTLAALALNRSLIALLAIVWYGKFDSHNLKVIGSWIKQFHLLRQELILPIKECRQVVAVIQILWSDLPHQMRSVLVILPRNKGSLTRDIATQQQSPKQARVHIVLLEDIRSVVGERGGKGIYRLLFIGFPLWASHQEN